MNPSDRGVFVAILPPEPLHPSVGMMPTDLLSCFSQPFPTRAAAEAWRDAYAQEFPQWKRAPIWRLRPSSAVTYNADFDLLRAVIMDMAAGVEEVAAGLVAGTITAEDAARRLRTVAS
jgi:hypothetical protein